jgi:hypothetical protein
MKKLIVAAMMIVFFTGSAAGNDEKGTLFSEFSEFVQSFQFKDWASLEHFITEQSKFGFGGEMGKSGFDEVFIKNKECYDQLLLAMLQGCKMVKSEKTATCVAPPQVLDNDVLYLGARAEFSLVGNKMRVIHAICGGD